MIEASRVAKAEQQGGSGGWGRRGRVREPGQRRRQGRWRVASVAAAAAAAAVAAQASTLLLPFPKLAVLL
jgi:anti-sigma-K factor RskA